MECENSLKWDFLFIYFFCLDVVPYLYSGKDSESPLFFTSELGAIAPCQPCEASRYVSLYSQSFSEPPCLLCFLGTHRDCKTVSVVPT